MKIAIIGTGNVGAALGGSFVRAGHEVTFAAQDAAKTSRVAAEIGAAWVTSPAEAASTADIIVLAVPYSAVEAAAAELGGTAAGKVVIDVTNPLRADYSGLANVGGPSAAERVAELLSEARVVKAFNTLFGSVQADPRIHGTTLDALYATDDEVAASTVAELASSLGFRPVRVGPLAAARELESIAWLNIRLQMVTGGDWRSSFVLVGAPVASVAA